METAELTKLIKTRRSIRSFQDKPVPEALLVQALKQLPGLLTEVMPRTGVSLLSWTRK